ncbi:hypothetical protein [Streptomyces sp. NPDC001985]|uniref:hypothetical protein n=1 Tax=Streptomyces sp. NPDC001985 TaxID=3154406 RepID=UPI003324B1F3
MTAQARTLIDSLGGFTHTGTGPQIILGGLAADSRGRPPRAVAEDEIHWLQRHFVQPDGFAEALLTLERRRTVLINGSPGDGRISAARVLLVQLRNGGSGLQEVFLDREEDSDLLLNPGTVPDNGRLLLDLSLADDATWENVLTELSSFRHAVNDRNAGLVVVLPRRKDRSLPPALLDLHHAISRPEGMELDIVKRHLRIAGLDPLAAEDSPAEVTDFLLSTPPLTQVAAFAQYLCLAAERGGSFQDWCSRALDGVVRQRREPGVQLHTVRRSTPRALLVATAMLHEARSDTVHRAAVLLLDKKGSSQEARELLEHRPLSDRLNRIAAEIDDNNRVRFKSLGADDAVRLHIWRDLPDLHGHLRSWVGETVYRLDLTQSEQDDLIRRFAEQSLRVRRPHDLLGLAEIWSRRPSAGDAVLRASAHALKHGLNSREFGWVFRRRIYEWSKTSLSARQRRVLVDVCVADLAFRHPDSAMVRLHHLARREEASSLARDALTRLVGGDRRLLRRMLDRLAGANHWSADRDIFLALSAPGPLTAPGDRRGPLIGDRTVSGRLVLCWTAVFSERPAAVWATAVREWLRMACVRPQASDPLLNTLVEACEGRGDRLGRLYGLAREWASARPLPDGAADALPALLFEKIRNSQRTRFGSLREETAP